MIARLEGLLVELAPTRVVIDVGGVGYEVAIPLSTFTELPDVGKTVALHVHTHVRESSIALYGFMTRAERAAFELLLNANRVGPKLAQTIVSGIAPAELLAAIRDSRASLLRAVPGIGAKMAERMIVDLGDRVDELAAVLVESGDVVDPSGAGASESEVYEHAQSALLNLGYPKAHAQQVLDAALQEVGEDASLEAVVRAALKGMAR
ncbi:Holliday junction branch migration protein RuvA [Myxococcota bacterium]|nr:Holliday junction branch migration protein RuvA [Myxococcota bacterium]